MKMGFLKRIKIKILYDYMYIIGDIIVYIGDFQINIINFMIENKNKNEYKIIFKSKKIKKKNLKNINNS